MHFLIKAAAPLIAGGGLGTGGVYVYRSVIPTSWREYLEREGFRILSTEGDNKEFKAIFSEYESLITSSSDDTLKQAKELANYGKVKDYCASELQKNTNGNANTQEQLIKLCTYSGITTVKAKVIQAKKERDDIKWLGKNDDDNDKYKAIFAVYKYSNEFLEWLNEGKDSSKITSSDQPSKKYQDLKNKCELDLNKKYSENKDNKGLYNHVYWWCMPLPYTTVKERIKKVSPNWEEETTDWETVKSTWENTQHVKTSVKPDGDPDKDSYKNWCTNSLKAKIGDDDIYKDRYLKAKSVCKKSQ